MHQKQKIMQIEIQIVRRCHIIKPTPHSGVAGNQKTITKAKINKTCTWF